MTLPKFNLTKTLIKKCLCAIYEDLRTIKLTESSNLSKILRVFYDTCFFVWIADVWNTSDDWDLLGIVCMDHSVEVIECWKGYLRCVTEVLGGVKFGVVYTEKVLVKKTRKQIGTEAALASPDIEAPKAILFICVLI